MKTVVPMKASTIPTYTPLAGPAISPITTPAATEPTISQRNDVNPARGTTRIAASQKYGPFSPLLPKAIPAEQNADNVITARGIWTGLATTPPRSGIRDTAMTHATDRKRTRLNSSQQCATRLQYY